MTRTLAGRRGLFAAALMGLVACGAPPQLIDANAARVCSTAAIGTPNTTVRTAFTTTLGRIRTGGYDLEQPDPFGGLPDAAPVIVCTLDTPKVGDPTIGSRITIAVVDETRGSVLIAVGTTDTLPLPTP